MAQPCWAESDRVGSIWPIITPIGAEVLCGWIKDQAPAMQAARAAKGTGGANPDWKVIMFNFMESMATYLRDDKKMILAIDAAREGRKQDAMRYLKEAESPITDVADALELNFVMLCDLVQAHPVDPSKFYLDGAYACSFQSKDDKEPFSSVCFKGTSTAKDSAVDVYFKPYAGGNLWGTEVSHGFWNGLFGKFKVPDTEKSTGFEQILLGLHVLNKTRPAANGPSPIHVTGHSMGGAYSTLFYAQFLLEYNGKPDVPVELGNICTFGSPRVGTGVKGDVHSGLPGNLADLQIAGGASGMLHSWRIVNDGDIVGTIPPIKLDITKYEFNHINGGYQIQKTGDPSPLASELGVGVPSIIQEGGPAGHMPWAYYDSLTNTLTKDPGA